MVKILSDEEMRLLAVSLLSLPSERTLQSRIGASNLANQCDRCLAFDLKGVARYNPQAERVWMGAEIGTSIHMRQEDQLNRAARLTANATSIDGMLREKVRQIAAMTPGAAAERHVVFGHIYGYGDIGGTIDLDLAGQIGDWKGSTRKKSCLLQDFIAVQKGEPAPFGRSHTHIKLSEREYAAEMEKMSYKMTGYYGQQQCYMLGRAKEGRAVDRGSIIWINRDGTGYFDRPDQSRYDDPKAVHDIWVLTFAYNPSYAEGLIARGQGIWDALESGKTPGDFESHELCWLCGMDDAEAAKVAVDQIPAVTIGEAA